MRTYFCPSTYVIECVVAYMTIVHHQMKLSGERLEGPLKSPSNAWFYDGVFNQKPCRARSKDANSRAPYNGSGGWSQQRSGFDLLPHNIRFFLLVSSLSFHQCPALLPHSCTNNYISSCRPNYSNFLVKLSFPKFSDLHSSKAGIKCQHLRQKPTEITAKYLVDLSSTLGLVQRNASSSSTRCWTNKIYNFSSLASLI